MASSSKKVIYAALAGNTLIAVTKFIAALVTGSSAMFSEGIHSAVDTGNQLLLLYGIRQSRKPADAQFPLGHGKEIYFWSFVVAILIFAVGAGISLYEGVRHLLEPRAVESPYVNYVVLGFAVVFEGGAWMLAWKEFSKAKGPYGYVDAVQRGKDPSLFMVLFEDSAALLGLAVAFLGVLLGQVTGIAQLDGVASVLIGLVLGGTAIWLAYETKGLLIGESANVEVVRAIRDVVSGHRAIQEVNEILTLHMGPDDILVNLSVDFVDGVSSEEVEATVGELTRKLKTRLPRLRRVFIEAEASRAPSSPGARDRAAALD